MFSDRLIVDTHFLRRRLPPARPSRASHFRDFAQRSGAGLDGRGRRLDEEKHLLADLRARWPAPPRGALAVRRRYGLQRDIAFHAQR